MTGGHLHREGAPAELEFDESGALVAERWFEKSPSFSQSLRNRIDGPAETEYYSTGEVRSERWFSFGQVHRVGGPAITTYRKDGSLNAEEWYVSGHVGRLDGPAVTTYPENGSKPFTVWTFREQGGFTRTADIAARFADSITADDLLRTRFAPLVTSAEDVQKVAGGLVEGITTVEGMTEYLGGAPAEWIRSYEAGRS